MDEIITDGPVTMLSDVSHFTLIAYSFCPCHLRRTGAYSEHFNEKVLPELKKRGKNAMVVVNPDKVEDVEGIKNMFRKLSFYFGTSNPTCGLLEFKNM